MSKNYRTPRLWIVAKMTLCVWVPLMFFNWLCMDQVFTFWWTFVTIAVWMYGISFIIQFVGFLIFGEKAEYKKGRKAGWHPYWDCIPPPFNNDTNAVRRGGIPEPKTAFTPPEDWNLQCRRCGARNEDWAEKCWECKATLLRPTALTTVPDPRHCYCPHCNKKFFENQYGDFDAGILCPYCKGFVQTISAMRAKKAQQGQ